MRCAGLRRLNTQAHRQASTLNHTRTSIESTPPVANAASSCPADDDDDADADRLLLPPSRPTTASTAWSLLRPSVFTRRSTPCCAARRKASCMCVYWCGYVWCLRTAC